MSNNKIHKKYKKKKRKINRAEQNETHWPVIEFLDDLLSTIPDKIQFVYDGCGSAGTPSKIYVNKKFGYISGRPDLIILVAATHFRKTYHALAIEFKRKDTNLRVCQYHYLRKLKRFGYCTMVARSFEESREWILRYLFGNNDLKKYIYNYCIDEEIIF